MMIRLFSQLLLGYGINCLLNSGVFNICRPVQDALEDILFSTGLRCLILVVLVNFIISYNSF